jgi:hypothetical protein
MWGVLRDPWRKSSHSAYNGHCVEVAELNSGLIGVRDTKDRQGPILLIGSAAWASFVVRSLKLARGG